MQERIDLDPEHLLLIDDCEKNVAAAIEQGWNGFQHQDFETTYKSIFVNLLEVSYQ